MGAVPVSIVQLDKQTLAALAAGDLAGAPATLAAATEFLAERGVVRT